MRAVVFYLTMSHQEGEKLCDPKNYPCRNPYKTRSSEKIILGNLDSKRDWGYAKEYVEAMWLMLQQDNPDDYVIATNETHTVREFLKKHLLFSTWIGMNMLGFDKKYERPAEVDLLIGNPEKPNPILVGRPILPLKSLFL